MVGKKDQKKIVVPLNTIPPLPPEAYQISKRNRTHRPKKGKGAYRRKEKKGKTDGNKDYTT